MTIAMAFLLWPRGLSHYRAARLTASAPHAIGKQSATQPSSPDTFELFAACIEAGLAPSVTARTVGATTNSAFFARAAGLLALGLSPDDAWTAASGTPAEKAFARATKRSSQTGHALAESVREVAKTQRAEHHHLALQRAQRAGVFIAAPLGLCFLPAFVCLGIAPVVYGLTFNLVAGNLT
ncbi:type II secretion system F family protein [Hoyosella rhizosphaerae]|nr:type II secretion system F family protein [Hoyosella rhizosphaerae]MBN4925351.1 type II secretion system F family protein [Hoyosella rhizosphaerae]